MTDQIAGRETARCKNGETIGFGRAIAVVFFVHLTVESYTVVMLLTFTPHSFIPGLKPYFSAISFHRSLPLSS